jgi:hypothetical protein
MTTFFWKIKIKCKPKVYNDGNIKIKLFIIRTIIEKTGGM